jgi:hypothetical protein
MFAKNVFLKLDSRCTEIDEHAVLVAGGSEIAQELRCMLIRERTNRLEFDDEFPVNAEVRREIAQQTAVVVADGNWHLLLNDKVFSPEPIAQRILIDFLIMSVTEEGMGFEGRLTNGVG